MQVANATITTTSHRVPIQRPGGTPAVIADQLCGELGGGNSKKKVSRDGKKETASARERKRVYK